MHQVGGRGKDSTGAKSRVGKVADQNEGGKSWYSSRLGPVLLWIALGMAMVTARLCKALNFPSCGRNIRFQGIQFPQVLYQKIRQRSTTLELKYSLKAAVYKQC